MFLCFNAKKSFLIQEHCISHQSDMLCFTSCLFKLPKTQPAVIGQLTHVWANTTDTARIVC